MKVRAILAALQFGNPPPNDVVILYPEDYWIRTLILRDIKATTIELFPRSLHFSLRLVGRTLVRLIKVDWFGLRTGNYWKHVFRQLYAQYILACIDQVGAKVVLTNIDNSSFFQYLSRLDSGRSYFAIQNGARTLFCVRDSLPPPPHPFSRISMTNFFCFGQRDVELFSRHGHKIDNYFPVGSLVGGYYRSMVSTAPVPTQYDLCLISQWHEHLFVGEHETTLKADFSKRVSKGIRCLNEALSKLTNETELSLAICTRSNDEAEISYYEKLFSGRATLIRSDSRNFSSYCAAENSRLVVALNSTMLSEIFSWGHKVLWCNIPSDDRFEMPEAGVSYFHGDDYEAFKARVLMLLTMPQSDYAQQTKDASRYICNDDPACPPHKVIRSALIRRLSPLSVNGSSFDAY